MSRTIIDRFFRPFLGGVFLEDQLETSSRALDYVLRMFAHGSAALPAGGIGQIARQLASALPAGAIRLNSPVETIVHRMVALKSGQTLLADAVVIASDVDSASRLVPELVAPARRWTGTTCHYFDVDAPPIAEPLLVLNASGGLINSVVPVSNVAPSYAPAGRHLVSVNSIGAADDVQTHRARVVSELRSMFGAAVDGWRLIRSYSIPRALPEQSPAARPVIRQRSRLRAGLFVAGDHVDQASLNGALSAGRRAAQQVLVELGIHSNADSD